MRSLALLSVLLLSGCFGSGPAGTNSEADIQGQDFISAFLHMDGCTGFSAVQLYGPGMNPARPPAGWRTEQEVWTSTSLLLQRCERVGLEGLERPATLLWEQATNAIEPAACWKGTPEYSILAYILNVVTDDQQVAERLRTYGLPVHEAEFDIVGTGATLGAEWNVEGETSSITVLNDGTERPEESNPSRWVWANETGSGWMDVERSYRTSEGPSNRVGYGTLGEPHVVGVNGVFVGATTVSTDATLLGTIQLRGKDCA